MLSSHLTSGTWTIVGTLYHEFVRIVLLFLIMLLNEFEAVKIGIFFTFFLIVNNRGYVCSNIKQELKQPECDYRQLNGNRISWTIEDMQGPFLGLRKLTRLGLSDNLITSVSEQALVGLDSLLYLDLSGNQIKTIHSQTLSHVPALVELQLNSTSLVCDCGLAWLPLFVKHTQVHVTDMYCAYPTHLSNRLVSALPPDQFLCCKFMSCSTTLFYCSYDS